MSDSPHSSTSPAFVPGLDALRFFAALTVIFTHLHSWEFSVAHGLEEYHRLYDGNTGVLLFYVLSGFLITTLAIRERRNTGRFSVVDFFKRRSLRIFPLYYLALACYLVVTLTGYRQVTPASMAYAATYTYNFIPNAIYQGWLGSFHTLATEEHFYLVFPFLFLLLFRRSGWLFAAFIAAYLWYIPQTRIWFAEYETTHIVDRWTLYACRPILIGSLAACIYAHPRVAAAMAWMRRSAAGSWALRILLLGGFAWYFFGQVRNPNVLTMAVSFAFLVAFFFEFRDSIGSRLLSIAPLAYLGKISYGLYVWQSFICSTGRSERLVESPYVAFVLVFVLAIASYELYEKHFLKLKRRASSPRRDDALPGETPAPQAAG